MNYIDLFSGIGGFALGAYWAGVRFEKHYFSEIDSYCIELYSKRFVEATSLGDITKINFEDLPKSEWIISGGFPCQDISIAGKGEGIKGERSGLWFAMFDVIRILRPRFAIIENVGAITHRGLDTVLGCLAEIGYDAEWQDIRGRDVGSPQKRERIWIVAYPKCSGLQGEWGKRPREGESWIQQLERLHAKERTMAIPTGTRGGMSDGLPNRTHRLKALGNSIVPQIAELLFRQIKDLIKEGRNDSYSKET